MQEVRIFRSAGHEFKQFGFHAKLHGIQFFHSFFFFPELLPDILGTLGHAE